MKTSLHVLYGALLIWLATFALGCSEQTFSSASSSGSAKVSGGDDQTVLVDEEIDTEEEEEYVNNRCGCKTGRYDNEKKVLICHIPPGNPSAKHEICVGRSAIKAHLDVHGDSQERDYYGHCKDDEEDEADDF